MQKLDVIVLGAGPAGLTAGIYLGRSGLSTLIVEAKMAGGEAAVTPWVENYPGFESISGPELVEKMNNHCKKFGARINELEEVTSMLVKGKERIVKTDRDSYLASAIILSTGTHNRTLNVPGEEELRGRGVSYCALCDGAFFKEKKVAVVGGGDSAAKSASYLSNLAKKVTLIHRRDKLRAEEANIATLKRSNVEFLWNSEVSEIKGDNIVSSILLQNTKTSETSELVVEGVFIQIGEVPNSQFAGDAGVKLDTEGYIVVDSLQRTNIPGVYAAGDVTNHPVKQIGTAVGQAIVAATEAFGYVKRPYYYKD